METRNLMSVVANFDGVTVTSGQSLWHYQDGSGFVGLGGSAIAGAIESRNAQGGEEMFARRTDGSIWSLTTATDTWVNTGGHLDTMVATSNGIAGTANGMLFHYQDNGGWFYLGGTNVSSVVESHNPSGQEELFARLNTGGIYSYTFATGQFVSTNGYLDSMIADPDGISGLASGNLWHYQDNTGWTGTGGNNIAAVISTTNPYGAEELFVRTNQNHVWAYTPSLNAWFDTGASLNTMTADVGGISGVNNGFLWVYKDGAGWGSTGGYNISYDVDAKNNYGGEVLFARLYDNSIWEYTFATHSWIATGGYVN